MKKYILGIIIIISVIFVSGCISNSEDNNTDQPQTLNKGGISINYPATWVVASSKNNETIAAVADPNSVDSATGLGKISVSIQKKTLNSSSKNSSSVDALFNQTYQDLFSNSTYNLIAEGNATVGQYTNASESVYTIDQNGTVKQQRAIWIKQGNDVYIILCTAPENEFAAQSKNFEFIINSFKIT